MSIVFASRRPPADPPRPAAGRRRGRRARARTTSGSTQPRPARLFTETYGRDARARRPGRRRRANRGLGGVAPARPGSPSRPDAGRDPSVRPKPERRRPGAVRLPRRGGRRRPAGRPPAVPDANLDPAGRHARSSRRVVAEIDVAETARADRRCRATDAPDPTRRASSRAAQRYHPLVREFLEARLRQTAGDDGGGSAPPTRGRRRSRRPTGGSQPTTTGRRAISTRSPASSQPRSPRSWAAANTRPRARSSTCPTCEARRPVLDLVRSRVQMQRGAFDSALVACLRGVSWKPPSQAPKRATTRS